MHWQPILLVEWVCYSHLAGDKNERQTYNFDANDCCLQCTCAYLCGRAALLTLS